MAINQVQQDQPNQTINLNGHSDLNPISTSEDHSVLSIDIKIDQLDQFLWEDDYQEILNSFTSIGLPNPTTTTNHLQTNSISILKIILSNLKLIIENYLRIGPKSLFDTRNEIGNGSNNSHWTSNHLQTYLNQITLSILNFNQQSNQSINNVNQLTTEEFNRLQNLPFTIQRLSELVTVPQLRPMPNDPKLGIHPHYLTLPKYLRAIQKVISITSSITSYSINTFTLSHLSETEPEPTQPNLSSGSESSNLNAEPNSIPNPTTRPTPTRARRPSTSTPITPVLSPIQWLINSPLITTDPTRSRQSSPLIALSPTDERPITPPLGTHPAVSTQLNDHPRIDEVDMGNGNGEEMLDTPVEISHTESGHQIQLNGKLDEDDHMKDNDLKE